jgi:hypothetical protein
VEERVTVDNRAVVAAMTKKVVDDAVAVERATTEATTHNVAESSPSRAVGAKRSVVEAPIH